MRSKIVFVAASMVGAVALSVVVSAPAGAGVGPPVSPASYINPDTGAPTANTDVDADSECVTPDQADTQTVGNEMTGAGNVHNDACLLDQQGENVDAPVSFQSFGVGVISACPDPDGAGPKTATLSADKQLCTQTGFEAGGANGAAGDGEYHIRLVSGTAGIQTVVFCQDPELNGCDDTDLTDEIAVTWVAAPGPTTTMATTATTATGGSGGVTATTRAVPRGGVQTGRAPTDTDSVPVLPVVGGLVLLTAAAVMVRKGRLSS